MQLSERKKFMGIRNVLGVSLKTFFNPKAWIGYDSLKNHTLLIWTFITSVFAHNINNPNRSENPESFDHTLIKLNISEPELALIARRNLIYALVFLVLACCDICYAIYLIWYRHALASFLISISTVVFLIAQVFKYHFWYFQIKQRRLGCTFQQWKNSILSGSIQNKAEET